MFSKPEAATLAALPLHGLTYGARGAGLLGDLPLVRSGPGYLVHEPRGAEVHGDRQLGRGRRGGAVLGEVVVVVAVGGGGAWLDGRGGACPEVLGGGQERTHGARVRVRTTGGGRPEGRQLLVWMQH